MHEWLAQRPRVVLNPEKLERLFVWTQQFVLIKVKQAAMKSEEKLNNRAYKIEVLKDTINPERPESLA